MPQSTKIEDAPAPTPAQPLASWYAQGLSDGLGDRLLMFDNSESPSLELLRFRPDLAQTPGFETALREQLRRLASFEHPAFARVRAVQRLEPDDDLALISNYTDGKRLSEVLHRARGPAAAAALIRQLAPALAQFQQHDGGTAHGLLNPDRIVVSPQGRLTIVEHAVGPAIDSLALRDVQLASMGIALPPAADDGVPRLDAATDWYQLGLVVLAVLMGRPVTSNDLPQIERLLDDLDRMPGADGATVSPFLRRWLERALWISGDRIGSGEDARAALDELLQKEHPRDARRIEAPQDPAPGAPPEHTAATGPVRETSTAAAVHQAAVQRVLEAAARMAAQAPPVVAQPIARTRAERAAEPRQPARQARTAPQGVTLSPFEREILAGRMPHVAAAPAPAADVDSRPAAEPSHATEGRGFSGRLVAALVILAVIQTGAIVWLARAAWTAPRPPVTATVDASGDHVRIDSPTPGPAPLQLAAASDLGWVRIVTPAADAALGGAVAEAGVASVRIDAPFPLKVLEGSRVLGSVPGADLRVSAGRHELELVSETLGYRSRQVIDLKAGENVSIHLAPPHGSVTIDASPWADVTIDGRAAGRTPLGPLPLAIGEHVVTFTHPTGGRDRQRITVTAEGGVRVVGKLR